jgi:hypothetical protein
VAAAMVPKGMAASSLFFIPFDQGRKVFANPVYSL